MEDQSHDKAAARRAQKTAAIVLAVVGTVAVLTWAVATLFEIPLLKALAAVILVLFVALIALLAAGVA